MMRIAQISGAICAAFMAITASSIVSPQQIAIAAPSPAAPTLSTSASTGSGSSNSTGVEILATTALTIATVSSSSPNATKSQPAEVTGGAIPQQMQASMAGLLGFCIMGLVML